MRQHQTKIYLNRGLLILIGLIACIFGCSNHKSAVDQQRAFRELLSDWNINLPVAFKVTNYLERELGRNEYGNVLKYFRVELQKQQAESLLSNPELVKNLSWRDGKELLEIRPPLAWWTAKNDSIVFKGSLTSKDKNIHLYLVLEKDDAYMLVETLGQRKEAKKRN